MDSSVPSAAVDDTPPPPGGEILVALDGTAEAERALPTALALARRSGAGLRLAQVVPTPLDMTTGWGAVLGAPADAPSADDPIASALAVRARRLRESAGVPVTVATDRGDDVAERLIALALRHDARAIVVRTRGIGGFARAMFGSVTASLLHDSPVPVVIVPPGAHPPPDDASHGWTVLAPIDATAASERVADFLAAPAGGADARVILLHVATRRDAAPQREDAAARLERIVEGLRRRGWSAAGGVVQSDDVARAIEAAAVERHASLIVMVGGGHGVLYRLVYGSTTDALARTGQLPVWVITRAMLTDEDPGG